MNCDFSFCIYQRDGICRLAQINIDNTGLCDSAIIIELTKEDLCKHKESILTKLKFYES